MYNVFFLFFFVVVVFSRVVATARTQSGIRIHRQRSGSCHTIHTHCYTHRCNVYEKRYTRIQTHLQKWRFEIILNREQVSRNTTIVGIECKLWSGS